MDVISGLLSTSVIGESGVVAYFLGLGAIGIIIAILVGLFWLYMLIDCLRRDFRKDVNKLIWFILLLTTFLFGAIVYYFMVKVGKKKRRR